MNAFLAAVVLAFFALPVFTHPHSLKKRADPQIDDVTVLNYALTLEHLENAFYSGALKKFSQADFDKAGLPWFARGRFEQVAAHEAAHVAFLETALGDKATKPCTYKFPYTDPKSFAALSSILEGVGVSAYAGAAKYISDPQYLTVAAVVLSTEARHQAWVNAAANKGSGWSGPLDVPLGLDEVFSLAVQFITKCPESNPTLPVTAYPAVQLGPAKIRPGSPLSVHYKDMDMSAQAPSSFCLFYSGLSKIPTELKDGKCNVPDGLMGTVYVVIQQGTLDDVEAGKGKMLAGPGILVFDFNSQGRYL